MGAKRYWEMLSNGYGVDVESIKLPTYATRGFLENSGNVRAIRMAIDARGVLHRAGYAGGKFSSTIADRGCLFNIICAFRSIPMLSLFVFDGASRRGVKRGRRVTGNPHNLEESMQDLLDAFGMEWARPDGEADREFSFILKYGMADCVLTDDNDALPHGITHVYRPAVNVTGQKTSSIHKFLNGVLYTTNASKSISDHIFVSICLGSDGDTGLSGVGPALVEILCAFQHHDTLIQCAQYTPENFESARAVFLAAMRSSCMAHSSGRVRAITFPASFPSKTIIQRYLVNPPGDSTGQHQSQSPDYSTPPCLPRISHWMAGNLTGCRNMKTLYHRAVRQVVPILVMRQLILEVMGYDNNLENVAPFAHHLTLTPTGIESSDNIQLLVRMPASMVAEMVSGATEGILPRHASRVKVWISSDIFMEVVRLRTLQTTTASEGDTLVPGDTNEHEHGGEEDGPTGSKEDGLGSEEDGLGSEEDGEEYCPAQDDWSTEGVSSPTAPAPAAMDGTSHLDVSLDLTGADELIRPFKKRRSSHAAAIHGGWEPLVAADGSHLGWMKVSVGENGGEIITVE